MASQEVWELCDSDYRIKCRVKISNNSYRTRHQRSRPETSKMLSNIYIFLTSFFTVALGELDFAVHVKGDRRKVLLIKYLLTFLQEELVQPRDWQRGIRWSTWGKSFPRRDTTFSEPRSGHLAPSPLPDIDCLQENSRRKRSLGELKRVFQTEPEVDWAEFQEAKIRVKRDPIRSGEGDKVRRDPNYDSYAYKFDRRLVDNLLPRKVPVARSESNVYSQLLLAMVRVKRSPLGRHVVPQ